MEEKKLNTNLPAREKKRLAQNAIMEYIDEHTKKDIAINTKRQIFEDLEKDGKTYGLSEPTFYRYLSDMNFQIDEYGKSVFEPLSPQTLDSVLVPRYYNKRFYYHIIQAEYGNLLANLINDYYEEYKDYFHCIALGDMLICFYYYKKGDENSLTAKNLREEIKEYLKKYTMRYKE